ncbi:MAG: hypothetical protein CXX71_00915 [Methanobacteriota archaeon]|nr:MAG: hypothetical protein CXX71_00915 [Euryarchaeota archaeon]
MAIPGQTGDTSHLYEGKTVRAAPPSRKKLAGQMKGSKEIPKDAVPDVHIPTFVESMFGGPLVPRMRFLPADKMVQTLQMLSGVVMILLGVLTYVVTPVSGTLWFAFSDMLGVEVLGVVLHLTVVLAALGCGFWGIFQRDARFLLASYVLFILVSLRFASSKVTFQWLPIEGEFIEKILLIMYAVFLVMYMELTNSVIRFSMLDTSIRTGEVYVMNVKKVLNRYHISLVITPVVAAIVAFLTLMINIVIPAIVGLFSEITATRLRESVELTSVYGVALGTMIVFLVVAAVFGANLPARVQKFRESA